MEANRELSPSASGEASPGWKPEGLRHSITPSLSAMVDSASRRFALCDFIKSLEKAGKSSVIDSFARKGLSVGAHRACDPLHDPLFGFFLSVKELGVKQTVNKWFPHMASDVLTARSLPLPGTFLLKTDSWVIRMYAQGLLNLRNVIVAPALGVVITEVMVRGRIVERLRKDPVEEQTDLQSRLQQEHLEAALIAAGSAIGLYFVPSVALAATFALGASAVWSAGAAGFYYAKRNRSEIRGAIRRFAFKQRLLWDVSWETARAQLGRTKTRDYDAGEEVQQEHKLPFGSPSDGDARHLRGPTGLAAALAAALVVGALSN